MIGIATLYFILMGFIGAVLYVLFWAKSWNDLKKFESVRHLITGVILGFVYSILESEYSYPNMIMALVWGWMGVDAIQSIIEKFKGKK